MDDLTYATQRLRGILPAGWLVDTTQEPEADQTGVRADGVLNLAAPGGSIDRLAVEVKSRVEPAEIGRLIPWLQQQRPALLVAPVIGARSRQLLDAAGISWMEPDGDCRIALGSLFIERLGQRRPRRKADEPGTRYVANLFAGAALRVVRWLLVDPLRAWSLEEMALETGLTKGFISRTFKTLARDAYLERARAASWVSDRDGLLDAWAAAPAPATAVQERVSLLGSAEPILKAIAGAPDLGRYALTAEAAADRIAPYARFGRVEAYVDDPASWDRNLELTPVPRGGNVVLLTPPDNGVFVGAEVRDGLMMVGRPQLYVDLKRRGGAAAEAATFLRERGALWPRT